MSRARDYVPSNPAQFRSFMRNLLEYLSANAAAWTNIPHERLDELAIVYRVFETAFDATTGPHTPAQNLARREAQAECTRVLRAFVNQFLRFPPVTNVDRVEMGIPNHDTIRTDHKVVTEMAHNKAPHQAVWINKVFTAWRTVKAFKTSKGAKALA